MTRHSVDPERWLPLKPDVFTILLVLLEGDAHGYRMMKAAAERTGRVGQLQPGGLYRLLKQMLDQDLVAEAGPQRKGDGQDPRRRYYRITSLGRAVAKAEAQRMEALVDLSRRRRLLQSESR
jgi:DNA-binding PadR family transcriptional regulator